MLLKRWQIVTLIVLQLLFAACATSVLIYNAMAWAPEVIDFGWWSYRAFNIYVSLGIIGYLCWGLYCRYTHVLPLLAAFAFISPARGHGHRFLEQGGHPSGNVDPARLDRV